MRKNYILLLALATSGLQAQTSLQVVDNYLKKGITEGNRTSVSQFSNIEYKVINENTIGDNIGDYVKIQQIVNDIPVYHSFGTFQIKNKKVLTFNNSFKTDIPLSKAASLSAHEALEIFASKSGKKLVLTNKLEDFDVHSKATNLLEGNVLYNDKEQILNYFQTPNGLKLAWVVLAAFRTKENKETLLPLYEVVIDANTGELLDKTSVVNECFVDSHANSNNVYKNNKEDFAWIYDDYYKVKPKAVAGSGSYKVIPANYQSPLQHDFTMVTNADDLVASKEGWHKAISVIRNPDFPPVTDFQTVGNNVHVSSDTSGEASDLIIGSSGLLASLAPLNLHEESDGGENLVFDFPNPGSSINYQPLDYGKASTTQMFYSINSIHDILHYHGFNPKAGSFQANVGEGKHVTGITLAGLGKERTINNAFMIYSPRLVPEPVTCFFTFETLMSNAGVLDVNDGPLQGNYLGAVGNNKAYKYGEDPRVTDTLVLLNDGAGASSTDGCEAPINGETFLNKVVLVDRGTCTFNVKVDNIKPFHPKGIIVINNQSTPLSGEIGVETTEGDNSDLLFPIVTAELDLGTQLKQAVNNGESISVTLPATNYGLTKRDSGFDSQVILHEYTHAVSGRLTNAAMGGEEGMNEGWSDYAALNLTQQASQTGADQIEIGGYAFGGGGMRPKPYTTDMSINPHTYDYLKEIGPGENKQHPTGYLWAVMLWEMHWKFVDKYGFNPDHKSNQGGNNMALDLVLQGQKIQVPNPGFVDGRDAILQADQALFNGENKCIIWEAFAKRGLGYSAIQGLSASRMDGTEAFDLPEDCRVLATNEVNAGNISIYPNPTKDVVYIMAKDDVLKAEIFDSVGRLISTQLLNPAQQKRSIDTSSLTKGMYVVKFHTKGEIVTKKIIKN